MDPRYRTIALQAVGVTVLAIIIFVAFLRPTEPSELSGIDAEDNQPSVGSPSGPTGQIGPRSDREGNRDGEGMDDRGVADGREGDMDGRGSAQGSGSPETEGVSGEPGSDADAPSAFGNLGTPTDDQYSDTIARLLGQIEGTGFLDPAE